LNREAKLASVREYLEFFPFELVRDGELSISDDLFLECLVNSMRNEIVSYQTFLKKVMHTQKKTLMKRIENLKNTLDPGNDSILELERV
jgi:hypothetical protein